MAVPWPVPFEQGVIQRLMSAVATICVDALGWFGIPAVQHGNVIEVSSGVVGVEEACSGVRSLQTTLMAALFLGELLRFGIARRFVLLGSGLVLAFVCNAGISILPDDVADMAAFQVNTSYFAPSIVATLMASSGVRPASTSSSSSRWFE